MTRADIIEAIRDLHEDRKESVKKLDDLAEYCARKRLSSSYMDAHNFAIRSLENYGFARMLGELLDRIDEADAKMLDEIADTEEAAEACFQQGRAC